jgi:hypothetical protein
MTAKSDLCSQMVQNSVESLDTLNFQFGSRTQQSAAFETKNFQHCHRVFVKHDHGNVEFYVTEMPRAFPHVFFARLASRLVVDASQFRVVHATFFDDQTRFVHNAHGPVDNVSVRLYAKSDGRDLSNVIYVHGFPFKNLTFLSRSILN